MEILVKEKTCLNFKDAKTMKMPSLLMLSLALMIAASVQASDQPRVAFITSVTGNGDLSSWDDADGASGLAAADAVCQTRAQAAGLANPGNFVAWLSDSDDDAYCRLHGLSGKRADNCGQAELPSAAGPWVRTDGFPFSPGVSQLTASSPVIYAPLRLNEYGEAVSSAIFTGTRVGGDASDQNCDDWSNGADDGTRVLQGNTNATGQRWTSVNTLQQCHLERPLACFEREPGPALPELQLAGRLAFVSSEGGPGNLSEWSLAEPGLVGIEAGDSVCRNLADAMGLPEHDSFKAWLSDDSTDAIDRFENNGRWVRVDGVPLAANKSQLTSGQLLTSLSVTEEGQYLSGLPSSHRAWTGTEADGLGSGEHCNGWSTASDSVDGTWGNVVYRDHRWTQWIASTGCDRNRRLYCLSDAVDPLIFADRFER